MFYINSKFTNIACRCMCNKSLHNSHNPLHRKRKKQRLLGRKSAFGKWYCCAVYNRTVYRPINVPVVSKNCFTVHTSNFSIFWIGFNSLYRTRRGSKHNSVLRKLPLGLLKKNCKLVCLSSETCEVWHHYQYRQM